MGERREQLLAGVATPVVVSIVEVKARENFVNFAYPAHSFDVFSFGVLTAAWTAYKQTLAKVTCRFGGLMRYHTHCKHA